MIGGTIIAGGLNGRKVYPKDPRRIRMITGDSLREEVEMLEFALKEVSDETAVAQSMRFEESSRRS